jgi:PqqD family protein of HPr-rel-A system
VVFDRNSGDFWVVPAITRQILLHLEASGTLRRADLIAAVAADCGLHAERDEASRVLDDLLDKGLVVIATT